MEFGLCKLKRGEQEERDFVLGRPFLLGLRNAHSWGCPGPGEIPTTYHSSSAFRQEGPRMFAPGLYDLAGKILGQPIVVVNKPGGASAVAVATLKKESPMDIPSRFWTAERS